MTNPLEQIKALTDLLTRQAQLLKNMQQYLIVQRRMLQTLLDSNDSVQRRYNEHVKQLIELQKVMINEDTSDGESVIQPDNGSSE